MKSLSKSEFETLWQSLEEMQRKLLSCMATEPGLSQKDYSEKIICATHWITNQFRQENNPRGSILRKLGQNNLEEVYLWLGANHQFFVEKSAEFSAEQLLEQRYKASYEFYFDGQNQHLSEARRKADYLEIMSVQTIEEHAKLANDFLLEHYRNQKPVKGGGYEYPVAFEKAPEAMQPIDVFEDKLSYLKNAPEIQWTPSYELRYFASANTPSLNGESKVTFALSHIDKDFNIHYYPSDYFSGFDSCEVLKWELMKAIYQKERQGYSRGQILEGLPTMLPLRASITDATQGNVFSGAGRAATLGVAMFFAFVDKNGEYRYAVGRRAKKEGVAVQPGLIHVAPAGMFQSERDLRDINSTKALYEETSAKKRILCEYLEEIHGDEKYAVATESFEQMMQHKYLKEITRLTEEGKCHFFFSGVAVDLVNLRPELCFVLLVKEYSEMLVEHPFGNFEYNKKEVLKNPIKDLEAERLPQFRPEEMVASGAACIWEGYKLLKEKGLL
jgi:hypothetical protein